MPPLGNSQWTSIGVGNGTTFRGWMSSGAPFAAEALPGALDLDDRWNLGAPDRFDEWSYNVEQSYDPTGLGVVVPAPIGNPSANYGVWFARTGVDAFQPSSGAP